MNRSKGQKRPGYWTAGDYLRPQTPLSRSAAAALSGVAVRRGLFDPGLTLGKKVDLQVTTGVGVRRFLREETNRLLYAGGCTGVGSWKTGGSPVCSDIKREGSKGRCTWINASGSM